MSTDEECELGVADSIYSRRLDVIPALSEFRIAYLQNIVREMGAEGKVN